MYNTALHEIGHSLGINGHSDNRIDASILYIMRELSNNFGHSYFLKEEIYSFLEKVLQVKINIDKFNERLLDLEKNLKIVKELNGFPVATPKCLTLNLPQLS